MTPAEQMRRLRAARKSAGRCIYCGDPADTATMCRQHADDKRRSMEPLVMREKKRYPERRISNVKKMKIQVGKTYHNGKQGRYYSERTVIAVGPEYKLYGSQEETECLRYRVKRGHNVGGEGNMTFRSFAAWSKGEVTQ